MSKFTFCASIICEGEIEDEHLCREKIQQFLNHLIDKNLAEAEHKSEKLKINVWRDKPVSIYRKLEL
jgi:hypothetical protein